MVTRWVFDNYRHLGAAPYTYTFEINPNEGGSPTVQKNMTVLTNVGPTRGAILQEGAATPPELQFSGIILTQTHYEAMEYWFDKRVQLEITDDLGRKFRGIFSRWEPQRTRRAFNPWYHTYTAGFTVAGYKNASGLVRYGKF
jgi:hypothetical protein